MRLIDADVFEKNLDKELETATDAFDAIDFALEDTPTIDAVPVVRCGECERRNKSADLADTVYCPWLHGLTMSKNDFCSYGEREKQ